MNWRDKDEDKEKFYKRYYDRYVWNGVSKDL